MGNICIHIFYAYRKPYGKPRLDHHHALSQRLGSRSGFSSAVSDDFRTRSCEEARCFGVYLQCDFSVRLFASNACGFLGD